MTVEIREYDHDNGTHEVVGMIMDGEIIGERRVVSKFTDVDLTDEEKIVNEMFTGPHLKTVKVGGAD